MPIDTRAALAARIVGDPAALAATGIDKLWKPYLEREVADGISRRAPIDLARGRAREILKQISAVPREDRADGDARRKADRRDAPS